MSCGATRGCARPLLGPRYTPVNCLGNRKVGRDLHAVAVLGVEARRAVVRLQAGSGYAAAMGPPGRRLGCKGRPGCAAAACTAACVRLHCWGPADFYLIARYLAGSGCSVLALALWCVHFQPKDPYCVRAHRESHVPRCPCARRCGCRGLCGTVQGRRSSATTRRR